MFRSTPSLVAERGDAGPDAAPRYEPPAMGLEVISSGSLLASCDAADVFNPTGEAGVLRLSANEAADVMDEADQRRTRCRCRISCRTRSRYCFSCSSVSYGMSKGEGDYKRLEAALVPPAGPIVPAGKKTFPRNTPE